MNKAIKSIIGGAIFASMISFNSFSQEDITVPTSLSATEKSMFVESVERNGFAIKVQGDDKDIFRSFEDYLEDTYKFKLKSGGGLIRGEELKNAAISDKTFKLLSLVKETSEGNELHLWLAFGTDIYVNSTDYSTESNNAKRILKDFVKYHYSQVITEQIEDQNKVVEKITDDLDDYQDDKADALKTIAKAESKSSKYDSKIKKYQEKIKSLEADIQDAEQSKTDYSNTISEAKKEQSEAENNITTITTSLDVQKKSQASLNSKLQAVKSL